MAIQHKKVIGLFCIALIGVGGVFVLAHGQRTEIITAQDSTQNSKINTHVELIAAATSIPSQKTPASPQIKNPYSYDNAPTTSSDPSATDQPQQTAPRTATDNLAKDLFSKYLYVKQTGQNLTPTEEQNLVDNALDTATLTNVAKVYSQKDLQISATESNQSITDYGNSLGRILIKDSPKNAENELVIVSRIAQNGDPNSPEVQNDLALLQAISNGYNKIVHDYLAIKVPTSVAPLHLQLVNSISAVSADIVGMEKFNSDPVIAMGSVAQDSKDTENLYSILGQLTVYFQSQNVQFDPKGPGYAFTHIHQ